MDGQQLRWRHLFAAFKGFGLDIDYRKLHEGFSQSGYVLRAYYYVSMVMPAGRYSRVRW